MKSKKIFILEDDVDILYGISAELVNDDHEVESSEGEEDMETLISNIIEFNPDYIILDLILPKLDGFEVLKRIKQEAEISDIPVFIFTDLSDEDSRERSLGMGADQYFLKDEFDVYSFAQKIKKIIDNKRKDDDLEDEEDIEYE